MMRRFFLLMCFFFSLAAGRAQALCVTLDIYNLNASVQTFAGSGSGFSPFDTSEYFVTASFQVGSLVSVLPCTYYVTLRAGQGTVAQRIMSYSGNQLKYNAYINTSKNNVLSSNTGATAANTVNGSFASVLGVLQLMPTQSFVWSVQPVQPAAQSGSSFYTDSLFLDIYEGSPGSGTLRSSTPITFQAKVLSSLDIAVVPTGNTFSLGSTSQNVDFGTFATGAQRSFDMSIRSNAGYSITMTSANRQVLVKTAPTVSQTIPYTLTVNNVSKDLSSGGAVNVMQSASGATTPSTGTNVPVKVTLGTVPTIIPAGTYQDPISINVSAF